MSGGREPYASPVDGGWAGYQAACHTCGWHSEVIHPSSVEGKDAARGEAWRDHTRCVAGAPDLARRAEVAEAKVEKLREALKKIAGMDYRGPLPQQQSVARAALADQQGGQR